MHAVVRTYPADQETSDLFDLIEQRAEDVKALMRGVPGFVSYTVLRGADGAVAVTVCEDKAGADESSRRAVEWSKENFSADVKPPVIVEGETIFQFGP